MKNASDFVLDNIETWAGELIAKSRQSKQIDLKITERTPHFEIDYGFSKNAISRLLKGESAKVISIVDYEDLADDEQMVNLLVDLSGKTIVNAAKLNRAAQDSLFDAGLETMYMSIGQLHWKRADEKSLVSPLAFLPIRLTSNGRNIEVTPREDEGLFINIALQIYLKTEYELELPSFGQPNFEGDPVTITSVTALEDWIKKVRKVAEEREWMVPRLIDNDGKVPQISILPFTFTLEAIYRDIKEHESELAQSELVQSLVAPVGRSINLNGEDVFVDSKTVDVEQPAEEAFDIFMSDSSQRVCIDAARKGMSFVIQGPPGTGKTQTITNIVSNLLHDGKTILFVADKATALDAVHDKLKQRNLDSFVLRFQDGRVTAKSFANQLYGILESSLRETGKTKVSTSSTKSKRTKIREQLNTHAIAAARVQVGFELPVTEIIGLATRSEVLPVPQLSETAKLQIRANNRDATLELWDYAATLATKWEPVEERDSSLWYSLPETVEYGVVEGLKLVIADAETALGSLVNLSATKLSIAQIQLLIDFRKLSDNRDFPARISNLPIAAVHGDREIITSLGETWRRQDLLLDSYGSLKISELDSILDSQHFKALNAAIASISDRELEISDINERLNQIQQAQTYLQNLSTYGELAAKSVGLDNLESWADVRTISDMLISGTKKVRPSAYWFHPRRLNVADLQRVLERVEPLVDTAIACESRLLDVFPSVGEIPNLDTYKVAIQKGNSWIRKLSSSYKQAFAALKEAAYTDINQTVLMVLIAAFEERKQNLSKLQALTLQLPELSEYKLSEVSEYSELLTVIKDSRTALTDVNNRQNALLNAAFDSALFNGNASSTADDGINIFIAAVERLFELQSTDMQLKTLLGKTTILNSITEVSRELEIVRDVRDNVSFASRFGKIVNVNDVAKIVEDLVEIKTLELAKVAQLISIKSFEAGNLTKDDIESLAYLLSISSNLVSGYSDLLIEEISEFVKINESVAKNITAGVKAASDFGRNIETINDSSSVGDVHLAIRELLADRSGYNIWRDHLEIAHNAGNYDAIEIFDLARSRQLPGHLIVAFFKAVVAKLVLDNELLLDDCFSAEFASGLDTKVSEFKELDEAAYVAAGKLVFAKVSARAIGTSADAQSLIKDRAKKTRLQIPVRTQLAKLGNEVLEIAPVVMASPINVSKYIPDNMKFDYVIFDEASQLYPAFALASLYRARRAIIAGDEKQMPPPKIIGGISLELDDEDLSEETVNSADYESLLDFAGRSASFPEAKLLWHYRSRNESLIAFSNHEFYKGDLYTFPSQFEAGQASAVHFEYVKDGIWYKTSGYGKLAQAGPAGTNPIEATRVANDVQLHSHYFYDENHPAFGKSLMVIATGKKQADAIEELVNARALLDKVLSEFLANQDPKSRFTVKNLETAQGDERDYVFLSFAYNQRSENNREKVMPYFGPLIDPKGWRRLNVAITRARYQMVLYVSCKASNIESSANESINHIRNFFNYAEIGYPALNLTKVGASSGLAESPFEEEVLNYITSLGYECTSQVGSAGYRLDIGVKHKDFQDVYMLGVECDGYMYHSSAVARDRDRIRQEILEGLGWTFHRIWGTRWYRYNENEKLKLKEILEEQSRMKPKGILVEKRDI